MAKALIGAADCKRLIVLTAYGGDDKAEETAESFERPKTEIWDFEKTYRFFRYLHATPQATLALKERKRREFSAYPAKRFLFSGLVLLLFARFASYAWLYVLFAAVCFTLFAVGTITGLRKRKKR